MNNPESVGINFLVLDASVWVSRLVEQDEMHPVVKSWMDEQRDAGTVFLSPAFLLAEVGGAITRRTGKPSLGKRAISALEDLPGLRLVGMDDGLMHNAARLAADLGLRGADSIYVAVAYQLDLPMVSLDIDQQQRAGTQIKLKEIVR